MDIFWHVNMRTTEAKTIIYGFCKALTTHLPELIYLNILNHKVNLIKRETKYLFGRIIVPDFN
jgi:hypothetical protein